MLYRLWFFVFILCGCHNLATQPDSTKTRSKTTQPSVIKMSQDDCSAFSQAGIGACHGAYTKNKEFCSFNTANKTCEILPSTGNNYKVIDFSFSQMSYVKNDGKPSPLQSYICVLLQGDQRPRCFGDFPSNYIQNFDDEYEQIMARGEHVYGISKRGTYESIIARLPPAEKLFKGVPIRKSPFSSMPFGCAVSEADELMCVDNSNKNIITNMTDDYKNILGIFYNNAPNGVIVYRDKAYAEYWVQYIAKGLQKNRLNYNIQQAAFIRDDDEGVTGYSLLLSDTFEVGKVNPLPGVPKAVALVPAGVKSFCIIEEGSQQIWCQGADASLRNNIPAAKVRKLKSNDFVLKEKPRRDFTPFAQLCALTLDDKIICFGQDGVDLPLIPSPLVAN